LAGGLPIKYAFAFVYRTLGLIMSDKKPIQQLLTEKPLVRPKRTVRIEHPSSSSSSSYSEADFMQSRRSSFILQSFRQRHSLNLLEGIPGGNNPDWRKSIYIPSVGVVKAEENTVLNEPDHSDKVAPKKQKEKRPPSPTVAMFLPVDKRTRQKSVKFCAQVEAQYFGDNIEEDEIRRSYYIQRTDPVVEELRKSLPANTIAPTMTPGTQSAPVPKPTIVSLFERLQKKLRSTSI